MELVLVSFFLLPLVGFLLSLLFKNHEEKAISGVAIVSSAAHMLLSFSLFAYWMLQGMPSITKQVLEVYTTPEFQFGIELYYDKLTAVYSMVASVLIFIVAIFSKTYMHRESGFKRFYNHFLLFYFGLNLVILSGNFETFFLGWEIVGITSFLLISFYRDRYLPVRNSMKVLSYYRLGDVALIGAFWFSHHLFNASIHFKTLGNTPLIYDATHHHPIQGMFIALLFVLAASVKSAQFPFTSWLPRAMEGPTTSSAIFYGSLSVHLGVFLLIRTFPIWASIVEVRVLIFSIGLLTALIASRIALVQPTAKTQLAYSSATQIGLMFMEIALGWHVLALVHFAANAFLRTYQLLISPSIMSYLIHEQFFSYDSKKKYWLNKVSPRLRNTLYTLSVKEWNMDYLWYQFLWSPLKKVGKSLHFMRNPLFIAILFCLVLLGIVQDFIHPMKFIHEWLFRTRIYAVLALATVMIAWTERRSAVRAWVFVALSQILFMLSVIEQHHFDFAQIGLYLSGTVGAFIAGYWCLIKVKESENNVHLNEFHGHIYEHPKYGLLFLICSLTMVGFPISPTFLGFDILFSEIEISHRVLLVLSSFTFIILELAVIRIYARVFLGQHVKRYHEVAFRSS